MDKVARMNYMTKKELEFELLEISWSSLKIALDNVEAPCGDEPTVFEEQHRVEAEKGYNNARAKFKKAKKKETYRNCLNNKYINSLPIFSGSPKEWKNFRERFNKLVHYNGELSDAQKLSYLRYCLNGEALNVIHKISPKEVNYTKAWLVLTTHYKARHTVLNEHLEAIIGLPEIVDESPSAFKSILEKTLKHVKALQAMGRPVEFWDDWLVYHVVSKLPVKTRELWQLSLDDDELPTFAVLQTFLEARCMPLKANWDTIKPNRNNKKVKLHTARRPWKPRILLGELSSTEMDGEHLMSRVRGILNKMTPEKFDVLVEEMMSLKLENSHIIQRLVQLVFEKAIDEPNYCECYARLCHRISQKEMNIKSSINKLVQFRSGIIDKCVKAFHHIVANTAVNQLRFTPSAEPAEHEDLLEEESKIRLRNKRTLRFVGELFNVGMLTGRKMTKFIEMLLFTDENEDHLEYLLHLLTTVGARYETINTRGKTPERCFRLDKQIASMELLASKDHGQISSRVRCMLKNVIDLRNNKWQMKTKEATNIIPMVGQKPRQISMNGARCNKNVDV